LDECPFDGDTASSDSVYTEEALAENKAMMNRSSFWIASDNTLTVDVDVDLVSRVMKNILADPSKSAIE